MLISIGHHLSEWITGGIGAGLIIASFASSLIRNPPSRVRGPFPADDDDEEEALETSTSVSNLSEFHEERRPAHPAGRRFRLSTVRWAFRAGTAPVGRPPGGGLLGGYGWAAADRPGCGVAPGVRLGCSVGTAGGLRLGRGRSTGRVRRGRPERVGLRCLRLRFGVDGGGLCGAGPWAEGRPAELGLLRRGDP
jgi:hypothetical protein